MKEFVDCPGYTADPFVTDDQGEVKGQCLHCGSRWYAHRNAALPEEDLDESLNEIRAFQGYPMEEFDTAHILPKGPDRWVGQKIIYCNHKGWFYGQVIITPFCVTIIADKRTLLGTGGLVGGLNRKGLEDAAWHVSDEFTEGGYTSAPNGIFVVPRKCVHRVTPAFLAKLLS